MLYFSLSSKSSGYLLVISLWPKMSCSSFSSEFSLDAQLIVKSTLGDGGLVGVLVWFSVFISDSWNISKIAVSLPVESGLFSLCSGVTGFYSFREDARLTYRCEEGAGLSKRYDEDVGVMLLRDGGISISLRGGGVWVISLRVGEARLLYTCDEGSGRISLNDGVFRLISLGDESARFISLRDGGAGIISCLGGGTSLYPRDGGDGLSSDRTVAAWLISLYYDRARFDKLRVWDTSLTYSYDEGAGLISRRYVDVGLTYCRDEEAGLISIDGRRSGFMSINYRIGIISFAGSLDVLAVVELLVRIESIYPAYYIGLFELSRRYLFYLDLDRRYGFSYS